MQLLSNAEIYEAARAYSSNFEKSASAYSAEEFYKYIAGMGSDDARQLANEFTTTALQFYLNKVEGVAAKNPLEGQDLIEKFFVPFHGLKQNMYVRVSKPVDPKFKGVTDGAGADPFRVKKPVVEEIYYTFSDDYQNYITISEIQMKTAFANENGVSSLVTGIMIGLASQFTEWETDHLLETFNVLLNDANIRTSQVEEIEIADEDAITRDELKDLVATVNNCVDAMTLRATSAFNIANFPKVIDKSDLRLCVRPGLKNTIKTQLLESAFNKEELNMDIKQVVVPDFGGLIPSQDGTLANRLYMVYDEEGRPTETYTTDEAGETPYTGTVEWYDPNADVIAVIAEKGLLFEDDQNAYSVYGIYNPRNMCTTYWANKPTIGYHYDYYKNMIIIKKKSNPVIEDPEFTTLPSALPTDLEFAANSASGDELTSVITIGVKNMKEDDVVVIEGGTVATVMEATGEDCVTLAGTATGNLTVKRLMIIPPGNTPVPFKISIKNSDKSVTYDEIDYTQDSSESPLTISKASE